MTTTTHTTEVITITRRTVLARTIFKARCGCGWKSCETHDQRIAWDDKERHEKMHTTEVVK